MQRAVGFEDISDGKRYSSNDIVKIACNDCKGCSKCCENMNGLITLDPYDIFRLLSGLKDSTFESLLNNKIEMIVDEGVLTPVLMMQSESGKCVFLNDEGRCSIHMYRPGICRLFPMGRIYEAGGHSYFIQKDECDYKIKTKIKVKNWLDTKELKLYEKYINDWHYFIKNIQQYLTTASEDEIRQINTVLLQIFYKTPYSDEFYTEFYNRLNKVKNLM